MGRTILIYGLAMAALLGILKYFEYRTYQRFGERPDRSI